MKIYNIHSGHPKRESFSKFRLWIEKGMGGKTRVFGKNRVFSTKPGFPGRTSVLLANPGYFKGLEAQGIYYIFKYDRNTDRNIIINLCWKNIELYKLTMDQQTLKTPLLVLVVLLPVLQGLVLVQVQLVTALPLPAASPKCACLGRRIWMPVYDPYKPDIHLLTVSGCMCGNAGAGGNLSKQHLYTTGNER